MPISTPVNSDSVILCDGLGLTYPEGDAVAQYLREGWYETDERAFVEQYLSEGDVFIDVGAHAGLYSAIAATRVGTSGRILACEPNPQILPWLEKNLGTRASDLAHLAGQNRTIFQGAVAEQRGEYSFYIGDKGFAAYSGLSESEHAHEKIVVPAAPLDDIVRSAGLERIDLIKVDIEGAELAFLNGAKETLAQFPDIALLMEFSEGQQAVMGGDTATLRRSVLDLGFKLFALDMVNGQIEEFVSDGALYHANLLVCRNPDLVGGRLSSASPEICTRCAEAARRGRAAHRLYEDRLALDRLSQKLALTLNAATNLSEKLRGNASQESDNAETNDGAQDAEALVNKVDKVIWGTTGAADWAVKTLRERAAAITDATSQLDKKDAEIADINAQFETAVAKLTADIDRLTEKLEVLQSAEQQRLKTQSVLNQMGETAIALKRSRFLTMAAAMRLPASRLVDRMVALYCGLDPNTDDPNA